MTTIVCLKTASSPSGVAYIGPRKCDGFKTCSESDAFAFDTVIEAESFADNFRNRWHGFYGFSPSDITAQVTA